MQIKPGHFAQACLTLVGLGLLVLAIFLNHYHPHNAGIATATHGNIYQLNLDLYQQPKASSDYVALAKSVSPRPVLSPKTDTTSAPTPPASAPVTDNQMPVVVAAISSSTTSDNNYCSQLDKSSYARPVADIAKAPREYATTKDSTSNADHQSSETSQQDSRHQDYLNAVASAYANYKQTLINLGCSNAPAAPAAPSSAN